jgi:serine protease AprX
LGRFVTKGRTFLHGIFRLLPGLALLGLSLPSVPVSAQSVNLTKVAPALLADMTAKPLARIPVILEMNPPAAPFSSGANEMLALQAVAILNTYGQAYGALGILQGAAGVATPAGITAMSLLPQVAAIEEDAVVRPRRPSGGGSSWQSGQLTSLYPQEVNAPKVWQAGGSGRAIAVAVLDSGVAADADLGGRVIASVGFAGPKDASFPDKGGHGTHVAGTIGGNGSRSGGQYTGMAPNVNIVDVTVLDQNGNGRISSVVRGIEWVIGHQKQFNIRVMNLSLGAPPMGSYKSDPLAAATEIAWRSGIVVVAAAGNAGPGPGTVESPGIDPHIITVGSTDDQATLAMSDDTLGWWSSWGTPTDSTARPDVLAPGRRVASIYVPGSALASLLPDHMVYASNGSPYFRLSGTSMSTAVVSGAAALVLGRQPALKPDQVKKILVSTAQAFGSAAMPAGAGAGLLDVNAAYQSPVRGSSNAGLRMSNAAARTLYAAAYGVPLAWKSLTYLGANWSGFNWLNLPWNDATWDNIAWDNIAWDNIAWDNIAWDQTGWDNIAWDNIAWDSSEWNNIAWDSFGYD